MQPESGRSLVQPGVPSPVGPAGEEERPPQAPARENKQSSLCLRQVQPAPKGPRGSRRPGQKWSDLRCQDGRHAPVPRCPGARPDSKTWFGRQRRPRS